VPGGCGIDGVVAMKNFSEQTHEGVADDGEWYCKPAIQQDAVLKGHAGGRWVIGLF